MPQLYIVADSYSNYKVIAKDSLHIYASQPIPGRHIYRIEKMTEINLELKITDK